MVLLSSSKKNNLTQVVVGVLKDSSNKVLMSTRRHKNDFPDHLEFPGGKKEAHETPRMALKRELKEELSIYIEDFQAMESYKYQYDSFEVELYPFLIKSYKGNPIANENEQIIWVNLQDLCRVKVIPGSKSIVERLTNIFSKEIS
tara:strand:+ start:3608 stop:4042 length:435 start_codon:yes stop_codon:yes gene_type:complete